MFIIGIGSASETCFKVNPFSARNSFKRSENLFIKIIILKMNKKHLTLFNMNNIIELFKMNKGGF